MYAYSEAYPQDEIFIVILQSDQVVMRDATRGYIYERIDNTYKNDIGFDFRNVKFRRWKVAVTAEYDAERLMDCVQWLKVQVILYMYLRWQVMLETPFLIQSIGLSLPN